MPLIAISIAKIIGISKNPRTPVIELNENGLQLLTIKDTPLYVFSNISEIHMEDRVFNGYLNLKDSKKKIRLDSVAIPLEDQREIAVFVTNKISRS